MKQFLLPVLLLSGIGGIPAQAPAPRLVVPIGHTDGINAIRMASFHDGLYLLTASVDNSAKLWDSSGHEITSFAGHLYGVEDVAFSSANGAEWVLTGSSDGTARLWDLSGKALRTFNHTGKVSAVTFSPDGKFILTGCEDHYANVWDPANANTPVKTLKHPDKVTAAAFSPDGQSILTGCANNTAMLWDLSGAKRRTFSGHTSGVVSVAFSPDGQSLLTGSEDGTARLWTASSNVARQTLKLFGVVSSVAFSPDGQTILTGSLDGKVKLWTLSGQEILTFQAFDWGLSAACFSPDGKFILTGSEDHPVVKRWNLTGQLVQTFSGHTSAINDLVLSPDGKSMLTANADSSVKRWEALSQEVLTFKHPNRVNSVAFSPVSPEDSTGGALILTGCEDHFARLLDANGKTVDSFQHSERISAVDFSPADGGKHVLAAGFNGAISVWDRPGHTEQSFKDEGKLNGAVFSPDGQSVFTGGYEGVAKLWHLSGEAPQTFPVSSEVNAVAFSPDGQSVLTGSYNGITTVWNLSGQPVQTLRQMSSEVRAVAFSPDGKMAATGSQNARATLWYLSGDSTRTFAGHTTEVSAVVFSPNGKSLVTGSRDGTIKIWDWATGKVRASLVALDSVDWVVTTPDGLFDASPGAMKLMYYVAGLEVIELAQLKERYYEPGLLARAIGLDQTTLRKVAEVEGQASAALFPALKSAALHGDTIQVQLETRSGGLGKAVVLLDGTIEIIPDANPNRRETFSIDLGQYAEYFYPDTANRLSLVFYNAEGWLQSPPYPLNYTPAGAMSKGDPSNPEPVANLHDKSDQQLTNTLFALIVGTSNYRSGSINLRFPDKDAAAFREMLNISGRALFNDRMDIKLLTTSAGAGAGQSSKAAIHAALEDFAAKAKPQDILLVFLSGHGTTWPANDEKGQFYYLTSENTGFDFSADDNRDKAIPQDSLQAWIRAVKARKRILILDACNSGQVVKQLDLGAKGGPLNADQRRALERMKDRSGFFVLAGSAADKSSFEDPRFRHGLLTYSLLRNIPKVAAGDKNHAVNVGTLFQEVREDVPKLAQEIHKVQEPKLIGMEDFSIGIINDSAQVSQLLATQKVITRSAFSNDKNRLDNLGLSDEINRQLADVLSEPTLPFTFWPELDKATGSYYSLNGGYEVSGKTIKVTAFFAKNGQEVLKEFKKSGADLKTVAEALVNELVDYLNTLE